MNYELVEYSCCNNRPMEQKLILVLHVLFMKLIFCYVWIETDYLDSIKNYMGRYNHKIAYQTGLTSSPYKTGLPTNITFIFAKIYIGKNQGCGL